MGLPRVVVGLRMIQVDLGDRTAGHVRLQKGLRVLDREPNVLETSLIGAAGRVADDDGQQVDREMIVARPRHCAGQREPAVAAAEVEHDGGRSSDSSASRMASCRRPGSRRGAETATVRPAARRAAASLATSPSGPSATSRPGPSSATRTSCPRAADTRRRRAAGAERHRSGGEVDAESPSARHDPGDVVRGAPRQCGHERVADVAARRFPDERCHGRGRGGRLQPGASVRRRSPGSGGDDPTTWSPIRTGTESAMGAGAAFGRAGSGSWALAAAAWAAIALTSSAVSEPDGDTTGAPCAGMAIAT